MISSEILNLFNTLPEKIIVTIHKDPDFDAVGSLLAMNALLLGLNRKPTLYSPDIQMNQFKALPGIENIQKDISTTFDLAIFLDCSDKSRIYNVENFPIVKTILNIDHHQDNSLFGDVNLVKRISSVGELLFELFDALKAEISDETAINLYAAICFDTGNFKFANTTASTFKAAAKLLTKNINPAQISEFIFEQKPKNYFEDIRIGLENMYLDDQYPFMIVHIPNHPNISHESTVNFFRQLENIELVIICKEVKHSEYRISFRSKHQVDVAKLAKNFNGGGHIRAAGATVSQSFTELKENLISCAKKEF
tara:strand:+ start:3533 stop:4459 length:927 start_codon:yes stop_codon:yes gene_type:complete